MARFFYFSILCYYLLMPLVIEKKQIEDWLKELKKDFKIVDSRKSILPAKQYFLPPKEDIFIFDKKTSQLSSPDSQKSLLIVFRYLGQLEAMTQLDEIMEKPSPDYFYWRRRKKSVLVGIIDQSVEVAPGSDMLLEKINSKQYQAIILTDQGGKVVKSKFFKKTEKPEMKKYSGKGKPLEKLSEMLLDPELLAEAVDWSWRTKHKIWDELKKRCLGCGICTYVCPICHCFSIEDRVELDDRKRVRCRQWDACTLPRFAQIAGGHNFHPTIKERYYNWYFHKFVRAYKEYGKSQCVACGQCAKYCPAGINIEKVLIEIVRDYEKHLSAR